MNRFVLASTAIPVASLLIGAVYNFQYRLAKVKQHLLVLVHFLCVTAIIVTYCLLCLEHYRPGPWQYAGWAIFAAGSLLFWYATFSHRSCLFPDEENNLVSKGPYRFVRHPIYSGGLLAAAGLALVSPSWQVCVAWFILCASLWLLASYEERELATRLGHPYGQYRVRTKRFIPGLL